MPAGTDAGSNGRVIVTGTANVVPCGVKANIWPLAVNPVGSAGAPAEVSAMAIVVSVPSAPGGISTFAPFGPVTVPPAAPITTVTGGVPAPPSSLPPPPQAASVSTRPVAAKRKI